MRSNTTNTEIRRIMKLHTQDLTVPEISKQTFITEASVQRVIDVRFGKKTRKSRTPAVETKAKVETNPTQ